MRYYVVKRGECFLTHNEGWSMGIVYANLYASRAVAQQDCDVHNACGLNCEVWVVDIKLTKA